MLQMLINAFNVLQYNDYCGDDCTTDGSNQHSYAFEVSGLAINALEQFFISYRLLTVHLTLLNPHLKQKLDDLEALAEASIRKMSPHAA